MQIVLQFYELKNMLTDAAELGAMNAQIKSGLVKPFLSASEARRVYGRKLIDRWIAEGHIEPVKGTGRNAMVRLDRLTLEALSKANNNLHIFNYPGCLKAA